MEKEGSEEHLPHSEKKFPPPLKANCFGSASMCPYIVHTSPLLSAKAQVRSSLLSMSFTSLVVCRCGFSSLSLFSVRVLTNHLPSKGCLSIRRKVKGLLSASVPPFSVFFFLGLPKCSTVHVPSRVWMFYIRSNDQRRDGRCPWSRGQWPGLVPHTSALIMRHLVRLILLALQHLYFWLPNGSLCVYVTLDAPVLPL